MSRSPLPRTCALASLATLALAVAFLPHAPRGTPAEREGGGHEPAPPDWFYAQRAMPDGSLPSAKLEAALAQVRLGRAARAAAGATAGLAWQNVGPFNIGGRVTAIATAGGGNPIYLGSANSGVWASVNGGVDWSCISDGQTFYSIGALALDPANPGTLYCGTGEANSSVDSYDGNGLWRTTDNGASWTSLGLTTTGRIAAVVVDPGNSQHLLVAAMGRQFSTGPDRGLYNSLDGGTTWSKVLYVSDSTGVTSIAINPVHPDTMYCATWERVRRATYRRAYGAECGIWRSIDRGATWSLLSTGLPAPGESVGRIALAVAPSRPSTVYAQIGSGTAQGYVGLGFYRSTDGGTTWQRRDTGGTFQNAFGGFCWYFGAMAVDPVNADKVYAMGVSLLRSLDGGASWADLTGSMHVDQHANWIDPANPLHILEGNDGGFYWSTDGTNFDPTVNLPISQFYNGAVDPTNTARLFGGTQDNNTLMTTSGPSDWFPIVGGDGFSVLVDPVNPNVVFSEYQYCCSGSGFLRSTSGGPSPSGTSGWVSSDRFGWDTPIAISARNHNVLIAGSQYVYRSVNNGVSWSKISADLSTNPVASLVYGTVTTVAISPADSSVYYAGTDDGRVWRYTTATGWTNITAGLPGRWVTRVVPDPLDPQVVYVTLSGFTADDQAALIYRSANRGGTWTSISGNLPNVPANALVVDPANTQVLYLATDAGVWITRNQGVTWTELGVGLPLQPVLDLVLQTASRQLFAFTHGRSAWQLDLGSLPVSSPPDAGAGAFALSRPSPNPAHGTVSLSLTLPRSGRAEVAVYDVVGRRVATLLDGVLEPGTHALAWDRRGPDGRRAASGVYFVRAIAGVESSLQRIVLID